MELSPIAVYDKAVEGVPSIKYAMAVAAVVAAATIAYNLSSEDPRRAVMAFVFMLAGMYLLLIFASSVRNLIKVSRGPVIFVVWALTILFISSLFLTLAAYAIGTPCGWAKLVGAACAEVRETSAQGSNQHSAAGVSAAGDSQVRPQAAQSSVPAMASAPAAQPIRVQETFKITDSSNDCGINQTRTLEYCLASTTQVTDWSGPSIESANCGSAISNIRRVAGRDNCIAVDVSVRGCGYDNIFGIKNCKGRGWIGGSIVINGQRTPA